MGILLKLPFKFFLADISDLEDALVERGLMVAGTMRLKRFLFLVVVQPLVKSK